MSKTQSRAPNRLRPHRLAPGVGGGGYLSNLEFRVKPFFAKPSEPTHQTNPKAKSSRPWRPSSEEPPIKSSKNFQKKLFRDLRDNLRILANSFQKPSRAALSSESQTPCQSRISLKFSRSSRPNTSPNLGILIELFASVRSGASSEASPQSQPPRFPSPQRAEAAAKRQKGIRGPPRLPAWIHDRVDWSAEPNEAGRRKQEPCGPCPAVAIAFPSEGRI